MRPKISVIIPVYNSELFLKRCLNSVVHQTYDNLEIIIINDGSTDQSFSICRNFADKDPRIVLLHQNNQGVSAARNLGLEIAIGDYIGFVDSDDELEPDMYEHLLSQMSKFDADIAICGFMFYFEDGRKKASFAPKVLVLHNQETAIYNALTGNMYAGHLCNKLFKSHLFHKEKLNVSIKIYEDLVIFIRILLKSERIIFDSAPLYRYYIHRMSAYNKQLHKYHLTAYLAYEEIINAIYLEYPSMCKHVQGYGLQYDLHLINKLIESRTTSNLQSVIIAHMKRNINWSSIRVLKKRHVLLIAILLTNIYAYKFLYLFILKLRKGDNNESENSYIS